MSWVYYIAKRHVPATCNQCGLPARPLQAQTRCFAGSRYWTRGWHLHCALKAHYTTAEVEKHLYSTSPFFTATFPKSKDFYGVTYAIPLPRKLR